MHQKIRVPSQADFHPGVKCTPGKSSFLVSNKGIIVLTCFSRDEISPPGDFTLVVKTGMRFHPGVKMQKIIMWIEINFIPGWKVFFYYSKFHSNVLIFFIYSKFYYNFIVEKMANKRQQSLDSNSNIFLYFYFIIINVI